MLIGLSLVSCTLIAQHENTVRKQRETILGYDLAKMRQAINRYKDEHGSAPQSLNDLVKADYLREIPKDPITDNSDWQITQGEFQTSTGRSTGVIDVHSSSQQISSIGTPYNRW